MRSRANATFLVVHAFVPPDRVSFRGLDGIRALAALGVLVSHALLSLGRLGLENRDRLPFAQSGVTIFFTLSGFLITYLLLVEKERTGGIALGRFYVRRILRIWPLYFFYIAVACAVMALGPDGLTHAPYVALFVLFVPNLAFALHHAPPDLAHLWSIGVEEQFYAFWPIVVAKVRALVPFLVGLIVVLIALRTGLKLYSARGGSAIPFNLVMSARFDCMATGALFAIAYLRKGTVVMRVCTSPIVPLVFWAMVIATCVTPLELLHIYGENVVALITGCFLISQIENRRATTLLDNPVAKLLGTISFGIYVYHPLVITVLERVGFVATNAPVAVLVVALATCAVAWLSFRFLEQPFLRLKRRYMVVESGAR